MASADKTIQVTASSGNKGNVYVYFNETDTSVETNQSKIYVYGSMTMTSGSFAQSYNSYLYIYWHNNATDNNTLMGSLQVTELARGNKAEVSGEAWFDHYSDGTGSGYAYATWSYTGSGSYVPRTGTAQTDNTALTTISRASIPSTTGGGLIGDTITINTNRTSNQFTHTITYACDDLTGTIGTNVEESVGWTIPDAFYTKIPYNQLETQVTIYCTTYKDVGGTPTQIGTTQSITIYTGCKTSTCMPDFDFNLALTDGTATSSLTGDTNKIIKGYTTSEIQWTATTKKGANFSRVILNNYGTTHTTSPIDMHTEIDTNCDLIKNGISATCYDTRGFHTGVLKTYNIIEYFAPSFDYTPRRTTPTGSEVKVIFEGSFFNDTFGLVNNSLTLSWRYKEKGGSWSSYTALVENTDYKISNNTFYSGTGSSASEIVLSSNAFDYSKNYVIEILVEDELNSDPIEKNVTKGEPVYWWNDSSFNLKVDGYIKGKKIPTLEDIYPVGSLYFNATNSANPSTLLGFGTWVAIDKFLLGASSSHTAGSTGGAETVTLTVDQIPSHNHEFHSYRKVSRQSQDIEVVSWEADIGDRGVYTEATGGDQAHDNMPPYIAVYIWQRTA